MEAKVEVTVFNRCKCCLEEGQLRDMWTQYVSEDEGVVEIFGEMIKECFVLPRTWSEPSDHIDQICMDCIGLLRSAFAFRKNILEAQMVMDRLIEDSHGTSKSVNSASVDAIKKEVDSEYEVELAESEDVETSLKDQEMEETDSQDAQDEEEHRPGETMELEYLEEDAEVVTNRKWPKKKKRAARNKIYRQYTQAALEEAMQKVLNNKMTRAEAALKYGIPLKTLGFKLRQREIEKEKQEYEVKAKKNKLYEEIRTILTYTNATPYKSKLGRYYCAYCTTEGPRFETADLLRTHTRTTHANERLRHVDLFMRPSYLNEILKLDIANLQCTVCTTSIEDWNSLFEHLKEKHDVELDEAYTRVIPYVLTEELHCCLCKQFFPHFHQLDCHMNTHYSNYICGECGDTFLAENRLKKHMETHSTQRFPCTYCGKVFSLEKYRKKHYDGVHLQGRKYKCNYCSECFTQDYTRHLHVVAKHSERVKSLVCEYCDMKFTYRPYYMKHIKINHLKPEKSYKCKLCPKSFYQRNELKHHEDWHEGRGFTCPICNKKFSSKPYLQRHTSTHIGEPNVVVVVGEEIVGI